MTELHTIQLPKPRNRFYYLAGFGILVLNKIRHSLQGYVNPRPFPIIEFKRAIEYDYSVVDHWLSVLGEYTGEKPSLEGRTILELGPGADLGIGLLTLLGGARKYNALDVNNLVATVPDDFYREMFKTMRSKGATTADIERLTAELNKTANGENKSLNYVIREDFNITTFSEEGIDTVFSQAAFEHFDDIALTFEQLTKTVRPGTVLIAEIDLMTHTRWIRDVDPLNIYRYSDFIYDLFSFAGSPNRVRPNEYAQILTKLGWKNIMIKPLTCVDDQYLKNTKPKLAKRFQVESTDIGSLSVMLCATLG